MALYFKNPANDYVEKSRHPWFWMLCFGWVYLLYKGAYGQALLALFLNIISFGLIGLFIYPFIAKNIIRKHYNHKGWVEVTKEGINV